MWLLKPWLLQIWWLARYRQIKYSIFHVPPECSQVTSYTNLIFQVISMHLNRRYDQKILSREKSSGQEFMITSNYCHKFFKGACTFFWSPKLAILWFSDIDCNIWQHQHVFTILFTGSLYFCGLIGRAVDRFKNYYEKILRMVGSIFQIAESRTPQKIWLLI